MKIISTAVLMFFCFIAFAQNDTIPLAYDKKSNSLIVNGTVGVPVMGKKRISLPKSKISTLKIIVADSRYVLHSFNVGMNYKGDIYVRYVKDNNRIPAELQIKMREKAGQTFFIENIQIVDRKGAINTVIYNFEGVIR